MRCLAVWWLGFLLVCPGNLMLAQDQGVSDVWTALHADGPKRFDFETREVRAMVDRIVCAATATSRPADAWRSLIPSDARVGLRVFATGAPYLRTHPAIVGAVIDGLVAAGIARSRIVIWDRDLDRVKAAGYGDVARGCVITGVSPGGGYDRETMLSSPLLGKLIWGDVKFVPTVHEDDPAAFSSMSHLGNVLSKDVDVVINLPVALCGEQTGMEGAIAQMVLSNIDNWRRLVGRRADYGDPYVAEFYADERIGGKVRFTIMDALVGQYAGGPMFDPSYAAGYRMLLGSKDPVAVDAVTMRMMDVRRKDAALPATEKNSGYLQTAAALGLGRFAPEEIRENIVPMMDLAR